MFHGMAIGCVAEALNSLICEILGSSLEIHLPGKFSVPRVPEQDTQYPKSATVQSAVNEYQAIRQRRLLYSVYLCGLVGCTWVYAPQGVEQVMD